MTIALDMRKMPLETRRRDLRRMTGSGWAISADKETTGRDEWTVCLLGIKENKDMAAFTRLFRHFAPRIKAFLMKMGSSEAQAEDVMQDAMAQVWRKAGQFDPSIATASTWIFTIVRNKRVDVIRKERRPEPEELSWGPEEEADPAEQTAAAQEQELLRKAVRNLPKGQREIVEKAYFGDMSHSEIAEVTGLPLGTIKSRIRLGLERLRHEMM